MLVDNLKTGVQILGEGEPVILLHGWGGEIKVMQPIAERLAAWGYQTHTLDLPGFGTSELPPEAWGVPQYGEWVHTYLTDTGLSNVRLIGHSFGGRLSIYLGATYPELIHQIVLTDSAGVRPTSSIGMKFYFAGRKVIFNLLKIPGLRRFENPVRTWLFNIMASEDAKATRAQTDQLDKAEAKLRYETFKMVINQDLVPLAKLIKAPTLLIWGENDEDTPLRDAQILEAAIPDAGLVIFENAGHYAYLEQADRFVQIVKTFFG